MKKWDRLPETGSEDGYNSISTRYRMVLLTQLGECHLPAMRKTPTNCRKLRKRAG